MSITRDQLFAAALELTEQDRVELAGRLLHSVPVTSELWEVDEEFLDELDRRVADGSQPIPWSQVREELKNS